MFDIGWSELLLVLVVALIVVGPKDLPRLMRMVGRWVGKARAMADQFRKSFEEMAHEAELDDLRAEIEALRRSRPLADVEDELNRAILPPEVAPARPQPAHDADTVSGPQTAAAEAAPDEATTEAVTRHEDTAPRTSSETHSAPLPPGSDPPAP